MPSDPPRPCRRRAGHLRRRVLLAQRCADRASTIAADTTDRRRRSDAAVSRAARLGDGWLGIWVSPRRFASVRDQITFEASEAGRDPSVFEHALNVWCGFAPTRESARDLLAAQMQSFYQMPFEPFERYSPYGTPHHVAAFLSAYIEAGCSAFNVIPCAADDESAIAAVGALRELLIDVPSGRVLNSAAGAAPTIPSSR